MWGMPERRGRRHKVLQPPRAIMMGKPFIINEAPEWDYTHEKKERCIAMTACRFTVSSHGFSLLFYWPDDYVRERRPL